MLRQKFKRVINGVLAVVMCVGTLTAVSYVQPVNVSAANGNQEWYNPALRWKDTDDSRENILIANAVVGQDLGHCTNAECPSNMVWGFIAFVGDDTFYQRDAFWYEEYDDDGNLVDSYWADITEDHTKLDMTDDAVWLEYGTYRYWADQFGKQGKDSNGRLVTRKLVDNEGKIVGGGNNTGTSLSQTIFTTYRVPEYTADGKSYADKGAVRYGPSYPFKEKQDAIDTAKAVYGCTTEEEALSHIIYANRAVTGENADGSKIHTEGWAVVGYLDSSNKLVYGAKITAPQNGGKYTQHHFSGNYCQSCGVWGTMDNDMANFEINNGVFGINKCAIDDESTTLHQQAGVEATVERTYAAHDYDKDNEYHKVIDDTLPVCIYCFGTSATTQDTQYHYHKHKKMTTDVSVISPNAMSVTRVCLNDTGPGDETKELNKKTASCASHAYGLTTRNVGPIGVSGCGYEETDYYTGLKTVQDYIGVVDGKTHYVSFNGEEVMDDIVNYPGSTKDMELRAKLTWDEGEPPHKITSGTAVGHYTITYTLPNAVRYGIEDEAEATEANTVSASFINGEDANKQIVYKGTAMVTLVPQNYENEDSTLNPNYTNNGWSMTNQLLGNLFIPSTGSTSVNMSGSGLGVASGDFATYDAYEPTWDENIDDWVIETGQCNNLGDTHRYVKTGRETEEGTIYDIWECTVCHSRLYIVVGVDGVVHVHHYYKYDEIPATCNSKGVIFRRCVCGAMETEDTAINGGNHVGTTHKVDPAPTCEDAGYEYDECVGCGAKLNGHSLEKLGHQWSVSSMMDGKGHSSSYVIQECERCHKLQTISSNDTVTSGGITSGSDVSLSDSTPHNYVYQHTETEGDNSYEIWQCDICGDIDRRLVEANGHTFVYRYTERDCITGTYEIWQCSGCGEVEKRMTESSTGHIWVEQSGGRASTCTVAGYKNYICTKCSNTKVEMLPLDTTNHIRTVKTYDPAPDCTTPGVEYTQCVACGVYTDAGRWVQALGHDYRTLLDTPPTCFDQGYKVDQCTRCYNVITETTDQLEHDYEETGVVNESQCTVDGLRELECKHCATKKYESIGMTGHTPGAAATCTEDQTCTVCGAVLNKATGHTYTDKVVPPTCTALGYTVHTCVNGDHTYVDTYVEETDHDYVAVETVKPTCTTIGYTRYVCTGCGKGYMGDYTGLKEHSYKAVVTAPTCIESGYTTYTCVDCGDKYTANIVDPLGHDYNETVVEGTCNKPGHKKLTCTRCGDSFIQELSELTADHDWQVVETVQPTCTDQGYTKYECSVCGEFKNDNWTASNGHNYSNAVTEPTCIESGHTTYTCSVCGDKYVADVVEPLGHDYAETENTGTCNEPGHKTLTCKRCGDSFVETIGPLVNDHNWQVVETVQPTCTGQGYTKYSGIIISSYELL